VISGIEKARKIAYFRAFLAFLSCRLSFRELGRLDFTGFLECSVANTLQTHDFSLLLTTPQNFQKNGST